MADLHNIFQNLGTNSKFLGSKMVASDNYQAEKPQILGATVRNLVAQATCRPLYFFCAPALVQFPPHQVEHKPSHY